MAVRVTRADRLVQILTLKNQGLTYKQIAERIGVSRATVGDVLNDPDGSKGRERKKRYQGQCVDCGGPTDGTNGRDKAPLRCFYCAQGKERPQAARPRLNVPICLREIPLDVRLDAVRDASRIEEDPIARIEILLVAMEPSARTYWVAESARPLIEQWAA